eukprot:586640-Rhodomonas_salina.2
MERRHAERGKEDVKEGRLAWRSKEGGGCGGPSRRAGGWWWPQRVRRRRTQKTQQRLMERRVAHDGK